MADPGVGVRAGGCASADPGVRAGCLGGFGGPGRKFIDAEKQKKKDEQMKSRGYRKMGNQGSRARLWDIGR